MTLHEERYSFVAQPSLLERHPFHGPDDASRFTLLDTAPDLPLFRYLLDAAPGPEDWPFSAMEILGTIAAVRQRALLGAGVAVLPRYFIEADLRRGLLGEVMPERLIRSDAFRLVWRRGDPREVEFRMLAAELAARALG